MTRRYGGQTEPGNNRREAHLRVLLAERGWEVPQRMIDQLLSAALKLEGSSLVSSPPDEFPSYFVWEKNGHVVAAGSDRFDNPSFRVQGLNVCFTPDESALLYELLTPPNETRDLDSVYAAAKPLL